MVSSFPHFFFARELCVRFDRIAESVHSGRTGNFSPLADLSPPSTPLAAPPARGEPRVMRITTVWCARGELNFCHCGQKP